MKEPTKADLAAAVAKLTAENVHLRDMIAAVHECAGSAPQAAAAADDRKANYREHDLLLWLGVITDPAGGWTWSWDRGRGAERLRELAAEPLGYQPYERPAEPEPAAAAGHVEREGAPVAQQPRPADRCKCGHIALSHHLNQVIGELQYCNECAGVDDCAVFDAAEPATVAGQANPPHMADYVTESPCLAEVGDFICNAQAGHDGPEHVAYGSDDHECRRWPIAGPGGILFPAGCDPDLAPDEAPGRPESAPVLDVRVPAVAEIAEARWCPAETVLDGETLYCDSDRGRGHQGSHHAPGPDEGSEVAWSDEPAAVTR